MLLLTTVGRKTGKARTRPLGYFMDGDHYVVVASNAGLDHHPAWYGNLAANPGATVQVMDRRIRVRAETADPAERRRLWAELMRIAPAYGNYEKRTDREIPLVVLHPETA